MCLYKGKKEIYQVITLNLPTSSYPNLNRNLNPSLNPLPSRTCDTAVTLSLSLQPYSLCQYCGIAVLIKLHSFYLFYLICQTSMITSINHVWVICY